MQLIPVTTEILLPPQADLARELTRALPPLADGDVVLVSSKVVAIDEGRCLHIDGTDKTALIEAEAEVSIPVTYKTRPLTIKHHTFLGTAGIDESNGNGYYILSPADPFASAERWHTWLAEHSGCTNLGVIITDSHSGPLRLGATGVALGWWGLAPLKSHIGSPDLFGQPFRYERSNVVDALAATANLVMGETNECTPVAIAREVPGLEFVPGNTKYDLCVNPADDHFKELYERFL